MDLWKIRMSHFNGKQKESPKRKEHTLPMLFGLFFCTLKTPGYAGGSG
jgi:hypothetical protein